MFTQSGGANPNIPEPQWYLDISKYERPDLWKSIFQLVSSLGFYAVMWAILIWMVNQACSWWLLLPVATIAAAFLVRIFIIFHDCIHNSFFISRRANRFWGYVTGLFTFTPFEEWQYSHNMHHNTYADLDSRGVGDIWTLTADEYIKSPFRIKLGYRLYRNPFVMFGMGPAYIFLINYRFSEKGSGSKRRFSVLFNNLVILFFIGMLVILKIPLIYFLLYIYVLVAGATCGVWLFYVQHQFEGVYWSRHNEWNPLKAAFEGSSYYKLPKILQWFSGNIGLHPIHHIRSRIPNYNLQRCYDKTPALHAIKKLSLLKSIKSLRLNLWDEQEKKLVSFHALKAYRANAQYFQAISVREKTLKRQ